MNSPRNMAFSLVPIAGLLVAAAMTLGGCASRAQHDVYESIAFPDQPSNRQSRRAPAPPVIVDPMDRSSSGAGGGGGGGGH